ncbi:hypothetical protein [Mycoavidus cysteinexigens]|nr:hypothetical protein [Mycoavidus cysteinexigens]GAM52868.1 exonuclease SbcC [bacterium endosymbiont of Mortierella elongata FMR23-6]
MALFDTLKFVKRMQAASMPSAQAEAEAEFLSEIFASNLQELATKEDLNHAIGDLRKDTDAKYEILRKDIDALRKEVDFKIERSTFSVQQKMDTHKFALIKWMIGLAIAQLGLVIGALNFFAMKFAG